MSDQPASDPSVGDDGAAALEPPEPPRSGRSRWVRRAPLVVGLGVVAVAGFVAWRQVAPVWSARKYRSITYSVPKAPRLTPAAGETVYRIDPTHSSLSYRIGEHFAGRSSDATATGTTNGIEGDLAVDPVHASAARVGVIVANLEQLHSSNNLRDARLRQDFLQSHEFPLGRFTTSSIDGLPAKVEDGRTYRFTMDGKATIKDVTAPVTWHGTASLDNGELKATAVTRTKLSTFDVGPISLAGMVTTKDDVTLTMRLTALDPANHAIPTSITGPHAKEATGGPSFAAAVRPILEGSCASCHNSGQVGSLHWRLDTAGDAAAVADGIRTVTETKYMPPWPASDKGVPLAHQLVLSPSQLSTLAAWAKAGGPLDVARSTPIRPSKAVKALQPRKDQTFHIPTYTGSLSRENDYRCFVIQPNLPSTMYLTGYTFLPDQVTELHHAQVFHISAEQAANGAKASGQDGQPGWSCYGSANLRGKRPQSIPGRTFHRDVGFAGQSDLVAGWVPGQLPALYPDHAGILLNPGDALVLQIHYHFDESSGVRPDHSGIALQLDKPSSKVKAVRIVNPLGPVEIPCKPGAKEKLCNRDAAVAQVQKLYGTNDEAGLLLLCGKTPQGLTANFDGTHASSSCNLTVPEDGTIIAAMGHMHTLGKSIRMTLDPDTSKQKILLDIPQWNFDWQMNYQLAKPIHVTAGEPLKLECSWDRSVDPSRPQRYITFAEDTESEMCFGTYALIPDDQ